MKEKYRARRIIAPFALLLGGLVANACSTPSTDNEHTPAPKTDKSSTAISDAAIKKARKSCLMFSMFELDIEGSLDKGKTVDAAIGVSYYRYGQNQDGTVGTTEIINPFINDCKVGNGEHIMSFTTFGSTANDASGIITVTNFVALDFQKNGTYGLVDGFKSTESSVTASKESHFFKADNTGADPNYRGQKVSLGYAANPTTQLEIGLGNGPDSKYWQFISDAEHGSVPVGQVVFYPGKTITEVIGSK